MSPPTATRAADLRAQSEGSISVSSNDLRSPQAAVASVPLGTLVLRWISTLSLDAPAVAVVWLMALGRPTAWEASALAVAVWWGYALDRWLDGWNRSTVERGAARHRFAAQHRRTWGLVLVGSGLAAATLFPSELPADLVRLGLFLALGLLAYIGLDQAWPRVLRARAGRELWVSLAVACAVTLFASRGVHAMESGARTWLAGGAFFCLCAADCRTVRLLERDSGLSKGLAGYHGVLALVAVGGVLFSWGGWYGPALGSAAFGALLWRCWARGPLEQSIDQAAPLCDLALALGGLVALLAGAVLG